MIPNIGNKVQPKNINRHYSLNRGYLFAIVATEYYLNNHQELQSDHWRNAKAIGYVGFSMPTIVHTDHPEYQSWTLAYPIEDLEVVE